MNDNKLKIKKELETHCLTVMINEPEFITVIADRLKAEDLEEIFQQLFTEIVNLAGKVKDTVYLILALSKLNIPDWNISKIQALHNVYHTKNLTYNSLLYYKAFESHYDIVVSLKTEKLLQEKIKQVQDDFYGLDTLGDLRSEIDVMINSFDNLKKDKCFSENIEDIYSAIEKELSSSCETSFKVKSLPSFNTSTGGIKPTNLIGIAGSYKSGKTTLALNLICDFAKQGIPGCFVSLELSEKECNDKILGIMSDIPYERIREPKKLTDKDKRKLYTYRNQIKNNPLPLYIVNKLFKETEIKNKAQYLKDKYGVKVLVIDYLGYMNSKKKFETREREMSYYSGFLKQLAIELDMIVIVLAQLNRTGKINPGTENLAESIALARDCDFLFITYSPLEAGMKASDNITYTESHYLVKLDTTRHSKHRKQFLLQMQDSGLMIELASEYDNSCNRNKSSKLFDNTYSNYYETEPDII